MTTTLPPNDWPSFVRRVGWPGRLSAADVASLRRMCELCDRKTGSPDGTWLPRVVAALAIFHDVSSLPRESHDDTPGTWLDSYQLLDADAELRRQINLHLRSWTDAERLLHFVGDQAALAEFGPLLN